MSATTQAGVGNLPRQLTIESALVLRIMEPRDQARIYAEQAVEAEARYAAERAKLNPWGNGPAKAAIVEKAADAAHRLTTSARLASRIVSEAEREYRDLTGRDVPPLKVCGDCGLSLPIDQFPRHTNGNPRGYCDPCYRARCREGWHRHREKRLAEGREYQRQRDPDERRAYARAYYHANRERLRPRYTEQYRERRQRQRAATGD